MPSVECKKCSSINIVPKGATSFTCNICGAEQEIAPEAHDSEQYLDNTFLGATNSSSGADTVIDYDDFDSEDYTPENNDDVPPEDVIYYSAIARINRKSINNYIRALEGLQTIPDWKDSQKLMAICQKNIDAYFKQQDLEKAEKKRRILKKLKIVIPSVLASLAVIAGIILLILVYLPDVKYNRAVELENKKDIVGAYETYIGLNNYKDSSARAERIFEEYKKEKPKYADVGDIIYFGSYEQDNNVKNGKEDIKWRVLEKDDSRLLLISEYGIDGQPFNKAGGAVSWESSSIRKYLNSSFFNAAFSDSQRSHILKTDVIAEKNGSYDTYPGKDTRDKVFLLSINETKELMNEKQMQCVPTPYCISKECNIKKKKFSSEYTACWLLRTPGIDSTKVAYVQYDGLVRGIGVNVTSSKAVIRPAMWIEKTVQ